MITSTDNQTVKNTKRLLQKKYRVESGMYLIEGEKLVNEAVRFNQKIEYVLCDETNAFCLKEYSFPVFAAKKFVVDSVCEAVTAQGVVAVLKLPDTAVRPPKGKCLILDGLQDPGNLGAIMRTAAACGYGDIYLYNSVDPFSPKVIRAAMSAHFALNIYQGDIEEIFSVVKDKCEILCADMGGENVFKIKVCPNHAIVIGNEGNGVSEFSKKNCSKTVAIPMKNGFESLNAAVSAGVIMYELSNKEI
ncbi:MAG TPA: RNA methyltransferase [Eubacteriales bacterium]|nr:RNA methyltransferase [Eubacteriales bacterium]